MPQPACNSALSLSLSHSLKCTHTVPPTSHKYTHKCALSLSLSLSHTHTHTCWRANTHTRLLLLTCVHAHALSLSLSHTHTLRFRSCVDDTEIKEVWRRRLQGQDGGLDERKNICWCVCLFACLSLCLSLYNNTDTAQFYHELETALRAKINVHQPHLLRTAFVSVHQDSVFPHISVFYTFSSSP